MTNLFLLGFMPSGSEWIIILLVILLLFGGKKIPELMRGLGKGVKSFKDGVNGIEKDLDPDQQTNDTETKKRKITDILFCFRLLHEMKIERK